MIGIGVHPESYDFSNEEILNLVSKNLTFNSVRLDYPWSEVETSKGIFHEAHPKLENIIDLFVTNEISPLLVLDYGNSLYIKKNNENIKSKPKNINEINAYLSYVNWTAEHFKNKVKIYEVWNEWIQLDNNKSYIYSDESARDYSILVNESCKIIKKRDANATVIAGGINPLDDNSIKWFDNLISRGVLNCIDGISIHPYYYPNNNYINSKKITDSIYKLHSHLRKLSDKNINIYITEIGFPLNIKKLYSQKQIGEFIHEFYKLNDLDFIKGIWWYDLIDSNRFSLDNESSFGIYDYNKNLKNYAKFFLK